MLFNSIDFLIYFPIVVGGYFWLAHRWRWIWLLAASYYFYMSWRPQYALLLGFSTVVNYGIAIGIEQSDQQRRRRLLLLLAVLVNGGVLLTFKYFNFFATSVQALFDYFHLGVTLPLLHFLLPVGISFYTFQKFGYVMDVYRREIPAEKHLGYFALYSSFFPQLVAGPIERTGRLLPQLQQPHEFDYDRVASGLRYMAWGFFKKLVIADKAALVVNLIYQHPTNYEGWPLILATYLFAFQIYCDFSGYSDIAIGAARIMGIELMENFRQPYLSQSIGEFWRRWHISLSTWFRDYLYIPLGGNRVPVRRRYLNLFIVFVVSGLWHGANWTFVIWGALHGAYLVGELMLQKPFAALSRRLTLPDWPWFYRVLKVFFVFHLVTFTWIFFRANTLTDALYIVTHLLPTGLPTISAHNLPVNTFSLLIIGCAILGMETIEAMRQVNRFSFQLQPVWVRWSSYYAIVIFILLFGELYAKGQFIYFQF